LCESGRIGETKFSNMVPRLKYISPLNITIIFITFFFLVIDLFNPGFQDDLWPYALIGLLIAIGSVLLGTFLILLRILKIPYY